MIKAVIFDMDGLLIDSEPLWREAEIDVFRDVNVMLNHQLCSQTTGLRIDQVVDYWYQRFPWKDSTKQQIAERIVKRVIELITLQGEPKPGVNAALNFFKQQNVKLALASSSSYTLIEVVLHKLGIDDDFQEIYSATEEDYGKPHPGVYLTTAKKLQVMPEDCLVLEDSLNGVIAAKAARMRCIAIPEANDDCDKFAIADRRLQSLHEIEASVWQQFRVSSV